MRKKVALRMDDVGASTKKYEVYSKMRGGNILFLKYVPGIKAWGPYRELDAREWETICDLLSRYSAKLTVGITAGWVEASGSITPFPEKFSKQADVIKSAVSENLLEIANHGLTHCVVGKHLPRWLSSNRKYHREFWEWVPRKIHFAHLEQSQSIFRNWLGFHPTLLIPPGNVYSRDTIDAAQDHGITTVNSSNSRISLAGIRLISEDQVVPFHDRELVLYGMAWFEEQLKKNGDREFVFVRDL